MVFAARDTGNQHAEKVVDSAPVSTVRPHIHGTSSTEKEKQQDLSFFFALAYLAQGFACAQFGLIAQPLQFFMMKGQHLSAAEASSYVALLMIPWVIKPVYGLICDFLPLWGYRYKSYLICANAVTACAFIVMALVDRLPVIIGGLLISAVAMAISTALMVAQAVEAGRNDGKARTYFGIQEIGYYTASIAAAITGGAICQHFPPGESFHLAAAIAVIPAVLCSCLALFVLKEKKTRFNLEGAKLTSNALLQAVKCKALWITGVFSFFWSFVPAFGVPLYFFESNTLHFTQQEIGQLAAVNALGMLAAAIFYKKLIKVMPVKSQLFLTCILVAASSCSYLLLNTYPGAIVLEFFRGIAGMLAILSVYGLASDACPARSEVSVMALLVAIRNLATNASTFVGGQLFTHVFHNDFAPLVLISVLTPALSLLLVRPAINSTRDC